MCQLCEERSYDEALAAAARAAERAPVAAGARKVDGTSTAQVDDASGVDGRSENTVLSSIGMATGGQV